MNESLTFLFPYLNFPQPKLKNNKQLKAEQWKREKVFKNTLLKTPLDLLLNLNCKLMPSLASRAVASLWHWSMCCGCLCVQEAKQSKHVRGLLGLLGSGIRFSQTCSPIEFCLNALQKWWEPAHRFLESKK